MRCNVVKCVVKMSSLDDYYIHWGFIGECPHRSNKNEACHAVYNTFWYFGGLVWYLKIEMKDFKWTCMDSNGRG